MLDRDRSKVQSSWHSFTGLRSYSELRTTLAISLGARARCAYCSDSRAADVEHFWPKSLFPEHTYSYENLLLICSECNRVKKNLFPRDDAGFPLLLNPTTDDPWDVLFFVPETGLVDARIDGVTEAGEILRNPRGKATIDVLGSVLNSTPVLEGRKQTWNRLASRLAEWLSSEAPLPGSQAAVFSDEDDFGLGDFLLNREGKDIPRIRALRENSTVRWRQIRNLPRG